MSTKQAKANVDPVRQRTQYSCMAASMMMCLRANDHDVTEDEVNKVMGARPMKGAAWEQALATAQHYGCRATLTMPATVEQLKTWTDAGIPIMIAWNPEGREWSHASVVFDVDDDLNVYVADPNIPNPKKTVRVVPEDEFYGKWYEKFPDYLVRRPACAIEREVSEDGQQMKVAKVVPPQGTHMDALMWMDGRSGWTLVDQKANKSVAVPGRTFDPSGTFRGPSLDEVRYRDGDPVDWLPAARRSAKSVQAYGVSVKRLRDGSVVVNAGPSYKKSTIRLLERAGWPMSLIEDRAGSWILPKETVTSVDEVVKALAGVDAVLKNAGQHPETPAQKALGDVWDAFQGTNDIPKREAFEDAASNFAMSVGAMSDIYGERGYKLSRVVEKMERHSRKWRTAWTLWVTKNYAIDIDRLVKDLRKTLGQTTAMEKAVANLARSMPNGDPTAWDDLQRDYTRASKAIALLIKRINHAINVIGKVGKVARTLRDNEGREWGPKRGLEGPLPFKGGRILYYDPREKGGTYYDPTTDLYLSNAQAARLAFTRVADQLIVEARAKKKNKPTSVKDKIKINKKPSKPRSSPAKALIDMSGGGKHHNRDRSVEKGRSRKVKHKQRYAERALLGAGSFWTPIGSTGWKHADDEVLSFLTWEVTYKTVKDRNIPTWNDLTNDGEMFADGYNREKDPEILRAIEKWNRQGWYPRKEKVPKGGLQLMVLNRPRNKAFEAHFPAKDLRKAMKQGELAAEVVRGNKYPRWMKPMKLGSYTGNPGGEPIYPEDVNHGEFQALAGGTDIMTRLQDELRVEQGHEVRNPQPRLAGGPEISIQGRRVKVNDAFAQSFKKQHRNMVSEGTPRGGFTVIHPAADDDPNFNGGSEYDFYFRPDTKQPGWWDVGYSPGYLILLQKDGDKMRAKTVRLGRSLSNTPQGMKAAHGRLLDRVIATAQVRN